jgi:hypothetical protein
VVLGWDQALPSIKEELVCQGRVKDAADHNANLKRFNIAGAAAASSIVHVDADKLNDYKIDDDNGIIAMGDIPQQPPHVPLIVNNTDDDKIPGSDDHDKDAESSNNDRSNYNNNNS